MLFIKTNTTPINMKKQFIYFLFFFLACYATKAQNLGFEAPSASPPTGWIAVSGTWPTQTNQANVRSGRQSMSITDPATTGSTIGNDQSIVTINSADTHYIITMAWARANNTNGVLYLGYRSGTTNTLKPSATTAGQPVNLTTSYKRIISVSAPQVATTIPATFGVSMRAFRNATNPTGTIIYIDDVFAYASRDSVPDTIAPNKPSGLSAYYGTPNHLLWTNSTDTSAHASGLRGVVILRTAGTITTAPVLNAQAFYHPSGGVYGIDTFVHSGSTWRVVGLTNAASYYDTSSVTGSTYTYAIASYDSAGNYSDAILVNPVAGPPMIYLNSILSQPVIAAAPGAVGVLVGGITVITAGNNNVLRVTDFNLNTAGTINPADITRARIFISNSSNKFDTTQLFGSVNAPNGSFTISGVDTLFPDTNYYWVVYDIAPTAINCNVVDVVLSSTTVSTVAQAPSVGNPAGFVNIWGPLSGTYTINSSLTNDCNLKQFSNIKTAAEYLTRFGVNGPVVLNVAPSSGPYTEQVVFGQVAGSSATNTITLNGNGNTLRYAPDRADAKYVMQLNGTDYLTIDNLKITGTSTLYGWGIHLINNANYNKIQNCVINMAAIANITADNSAGIVATNSLTAVGQTGANASYLTIMSDTIIGAYAGVNLAGSAAAKGINNIVTSCVVKDFSAHGIEFLQQDSMVVSLNDISRAGAVDVTTFEGIEVGAANKRCIITRNKIHDTHNSAAVKTGTAYGIYFVSCDAHVDSQNIVTNNLIYRFNSVSGTQYGIYNSSSDGVKYYHNTVVLNDSASTAGITRGFYQVTAATNIDFRNNIIYITRAGTGAKNCIYLGTTTSTVVSNNNILYMNSPAGTNGVGYYSSNRVTLADWQTANGGIYDLQSKDIDPVFTSLSTPDYMPTRVAINNTGANVGVAVDLLGNARSTTPDPGAIEFTPAATLDAKIDWVAPMSPVASGNRQIVVEVTNNLTDPVTSIELGYTDGTTTVSESFGSLNILTTGKQQFSFSTPYNFTAATSIKAYIRFVNNTTDAARVNDTAMQDICIGMSGGAYTINSNQPASSTNFTNFTNAVSAISCGILGPVTFTVDPNSGPYNEQITIPAITNASATNTITFKGNLRKLQATPVSATRHIIKLDGAKYITFDSLQIVGLATDYGWGVFLTNGADSNTISNCVIDMSNVTSTTQSNSGGIVGSGSATSVTTDGNSSYNNITGNTITGAYQGIIINGVTGAIKAVNNKILNNTIRDFYANGIELTDNDSTIVGYNDISRAQRTSVTTFTGVELGAGNKRTRVIGNKIHDTHNSASSTTGTAYGISSASDDAPAGQENIVANNAIYGFNSSTGTQYGLYNSGSDGVIYLYNSVLLDNAASTSGTTRGFYQTTAASGIELRNNIFSITRGGTTAKHCLYFGTTTSTIVSNYNILHMNAPAGTNGIGSFGTTNYATLANWRTANGAIYDLQSKSVDPLFNTPDNLRPFTGSTVINSGTPVALITTDQIGTLRNASTPTPGAYEAVGDFSPPVIVLGAISNTISTANRTFTGLATVTDRTGVNTSAKPRLYFKRAADNNAFNGNTFADNGWKYVEATNASTPFDFTIDYALLFGGVASQGDSIQYFVVAQDVSSNNNVGISSGVFASTPAGVNLTASAFPVTGNISYYRILPILPAGTYTVGASGNYQDLTAVADVIRGSVLGGDVMFELLPDYSTSSELFPVHFGIMNRVNPLSKVTIRPASSVTTMLVTEGQTGSDDPLIDLDGSHNLTFDGRPGGAGDTSNIRWMIRNKRTSATFSPVFRFVNDAYSNTLQYLNMESSNGLTTSGTVLLSTTTGTIGNDSNTIRYNIISDRSDTIGYPVNAIYSQGTAEALNDDNRIYGNRISNFATNGVHVTATGNGSNWIISNNHFYATDSMSGAQASVRFLSTGVKNAIDSNIIGGSTLNAGGPAWVNKANVAWRGIVCTTGTTDSTFIRNNKIQNISLAGTGSGTYAGIEITAGLVSINNNIIGDSTTANSITSSLLGTHLNITTTGAAIVAIYENKISNISSTGTTSAIGLRGITHTGTNTTQPVIIRNNTVRKLSAATQTVSSSTSAVQGIYTDVANKNQQITDNSVSELSSDGGPGGMFPTRCVGINVADPAGAGIIVRNRVWGFSHTGLSQEALVAGIHLFAGADWTIANNMISLGSQVSSDVKIVGIMDSAVGVVKVHFNTVQIDGATSGSNTSVRSYAYRRVRSSQANVSNNIFSNIRTGSGSHFALGNTGGQYLSDYNALYAANSATLGEWNTTSTDFAAWKSTSMRDNGSVNQQATFVSATNLHLAAPSIGNNAFAGRPVNGISTDFDNQARSATFPYMGADENPANPLTGFIPVLNGPLYTVGASGNYLNLTAVAYALNNSTVAADLVFELQSDYDGYSEAFPVSFNQYATSGGNWNVTVRPAASTTARITTGDPGSAGFPLIRFDGADRITFDGRPGGTGTATEWTIRNTRNAATFSPAIVLMNDAKHNTLRNLIVMSGNTLSTSGTIMIAGTDLTSGNDSNVIRFNKIRDLDSISGIPANGIYCAGTAGAANDYNTIENNEVFNFTTSGISVAATGNSNSWQVNNNHVYYNNAMVPTTAQTGINFAATGNAHSITGNYIGGNTVNAGGTAWSNSGANLFMGIDVDVDTIGYTIVSNNTIGNIAKTATGAASFSGIRMEKGRVKLLNNTVGHNTTANSITSAGTSFVYGIDIQNTTGTADTLVISGNIVANINNTGTSAGSRIRGISYGYGDVSPMVRITDNVVHHLSTTGIAESYAADLITCTGMMLFPNGYRSGSVTGNNTVYAIEAAATTANATFSAGITASNYAGEIFNNKIYDIRNRSTSPTGTTTAVVAGLFTRFLSNTRVYNNMISVSGTGSSDSAQLNGILIAGNGGGTHNYYHNSVNVSNGTGSQVSTYAFHRGQNNVTTASAHPISLRNNIFQNNTALPAGRHFAIWIEDTATVVANASDWNVYKTADTSKLAVWGTSVNNLAAWRVKTNSDGNTRVTSVNFTNATTGDLHLVLSSIGDQNLAGTPLAAVTVDIDNDIRNTVKPYMGADENTAFPLPVVLVQFDARKAGNDVVLNWATSSERNASHYEVQRSINDRDFITAGKVKARGNSSVLTRYSLDDNNAFVRAGADVLYYRLKMVDVNGDIEFSKTVIVRNDRQAKELPLTVYPNPFSSEVYFSISTLKAGQANIRVADITGRVVIDYSTLVSEGDNTLQITHTELLKSGVYFVVVETAEGAQSAKLIKQ